MHPDMMRQLAADHIRELTSQAGDARRTHEGAAPGGGSAAGSPVAVNPAVRAATRVPPGIRDPGPLGRERPGGKLPAMNAVTAVGSVSVISTGPVRIHPERDHIQLPGMNWHQVSLEQTADPALAPLAETLDLMGDGSLMLLPTPGHSADSVSLLVCRADRPALLLTGDLTYGAELMCGGQFPGVGRRRELAASTRKVLGLARRHPGLVMLPAHDPTARPAAARERARRVEGPGGQWCRSCTGRR